MEYAVDDSWEMPDYIKKMSKEELRREIEIQEYGKVVSRPPNAQPATQN
jgi:hypothetical protein